jgi:glycosyltransferase involved in cell wall biosynthesis
VSTETGSDPLGVCTNPERGAKLRVALNAIAELTPNHGARVYLLALAEALSELSDIELILMVGHAQSQYLAPRLQRFARELPVPVGRSYWQAILQHRIDRYLQDWKVDIYHVPNSCPLFRKPIKTVITIHDLTELRTHKYGRARTLYRRWVNRAATQAADRVLTVSDNSKRDLMQLLCVPEDKITVIYPGVDEMFHPLNRDDCMAYLSANYSLTKEFILAPGGLGRNKNVCGLLAAFAALQSVGAPQLLVFTGVVDPGEMRSIAATICRLGLTDRVVFTGHVPGRDLPRFYNACSVVAYVSLYEGFGLPVLEGMACGAPMVVSNTSSIPEVVGDAALKVNPYDTDAIALSLQRILSSAGLRRELIMRGLARVRAFRWSRTAVRTAEVYFKMASQTRA